MNSGRAGGNVVGLVFKKNRNIYVGRFQRHFAVGQK